MENYDEVFDRLMHSIGENGKFQKCFNLFYNFLLAIASGMVYMSLIMVMAIPRHWCHVPGSNENGTNATTQDWKSLHIPMIINPRGVEDFSGCQMYNTSIEERFNVSIWQIVNASITCQHGYEYDGSWYDTTVPSSQNWVCEDELHVTNVFTFCRISEVAGALILGSLGDMWGRRPVYLISMVITLLGRIVSLFTADFFWVFLFSCILASFPSMTLCQSILVISMEISEPEYRSRLAVTQSIGWIFATCINALLYWILRDWRIFMAASIFPLIPFLLACGYMIESPRWLATTGKVKQCVKVLRQIAKTNGTVLSSDTERALELLNNASKRKLNTIGVIGLFSSWTIAKNTLLLVMNWVTVILTGIILILNISNLEGNPFVNYAMISIMELPGYLVGMIVSSHLGRRWTGIIAYSMCVISLTPLAVIYSAQGAWISISLIAIAKLGLTMASLMAELQTMEIYPTCIRQTGMSLGSIVSSVFGTLGPYILFLGTKYDSRYPYVIVTTLCLVAGISEFFLPETLHQKLPETLHEARQFGNYQEYWSIPRNNKHGFDDGVRYNNKKIFIFSQE